MEQMGEGSPFFSIAPITARFFSGDHRPHLRIGTQLKFWCSGASCLTSLGPELLSSFGSWQWGGYRIML